MKSAKYILMMPLVTLGVVFSTPSKANDPNYKNFSDPIAASDFCNQVAPSVDYCNITHTYIRKVDLDIWRVDYLIKEHQENVTITQHRPYLTYSKASDFCSTAGNTVQNCSVQQKSASGETWWESTYTDEVSNACGVCIDPPEPALPSEEQNL